VHSKLKKRCAGVPCSLAKFCCLIVIVGDARPPLYWYALPRINRRASSLSNFSIM
jgi:hypothetical protein